MPIGYARRAFLEPIHPQRTDLPSKEKNGGVARVAVLATDEVPVCPLCQCTERSEIIEGVRDWFFDCADGNWTFVRCADCCSLYMDPRPTADTLPLAYRFYYTHERPEAASSGKTRPGMRRWLANSLLNARFGLSLMPAIPLPLPQWAVRSFVAGKLEARFRFLPRLWPGARVLDVGCGSGSFLRRINAAGWMGYGVDLDHVAVARAHASGLRVNLGDIHSAEEFGVEFDAITLNHVIEHVLDPLDVLTACRTLLTPSGVLHLEFPNPMASSLAHFGRFWRGLEAPRHIALPSKKPLPTSWKRLVSSE